MKLIKLNAWRTLVFTVLILLGIGCSKASNNPAQELDYGCDSKVILKTISNANAKLYYNTSLAKWFISIDDLPPTSVSCVFCDDTVINSIIAGQPLTAIINVTVSGNIKRKVEGQLPPEQVTSYPLPYLIVVTSIAK